MASHILMSRVYDSGAFRRMRYFCRISSSSLDVETCEDLFPPSPEKNPKVCASSSDGLLCLEYSDDDWNTCAFTFWVPSSNEFKSLPDHIWGPSPCPESRRYHRDRGIGCSKSISSSARGLGFDYKSKDYKFIQFNKLDYSDADMMDDSHSKAMQAAVYSLKTNSWKDKSVSWNKFFHGRHCSEFDDLRATDVGGRLYWIVVGHYIVSFDLAGEEFFRLPLPDLLVQSDLCRYGSTLMELHGALALLIQRALGPHDKLYVFCVWEMETETWTRKTCYDFCASQVDRPMGFCRNYELFLLQGIDGKLLVYDYTVPELKKIHQIYDYPHTYSMRLFPYVNNTITFHE